MLPEPSKGKISTWMFFHFYNVLNICLKLCNYALQAKYGQSLDLQRGGVRFPQLDIYSWEHVARDGGVQVGV